MCCSYCTTTHITICKECQWTCPACSVLVKKFFEQVKEDTPEEPIQFPCDIAFHHLDHIDDYSTLGNNDLSNMENDSRCPFGPTPEARNGHKGYS